MSHIAVAGLEALPGQTPTHPKNTTDSPIRHVLVNKRRAPAANLPRPSRRAQGLQRNIPRHPVFGADDRHGAYPHDGRRPVRYHWIATTNSEDRCVNISYPKFVRHCGRALAIATMAVAAKIAISASYTAGDFGIPMALALAVGIADALAIWTITNHLADRC
jgi:hypothetical protein